MPGSTWQDTTAILMKLDEIITLLRTIVEQQTDNTGE